MVQPLLPMVGTQTSRWTMQMILHRFKTRWPGGREEGIT
jgi:hypothetical protein